MVMRHEQEMLLTGVYAILSRERGQSRHGLSGEVPNRMQHVSGMDPVVIYHEQQRAVNA